MNQRPLGFVETYCKIANDLNQSYNLITVAKFYFNNINENIILDSFNLLINKFPSLRASINNQPILRFSLNTQKASEHIRIVTADQVSLSEVIANLTEAVFTDNLLWRAVIITNKESHYHHLIFSLHHAIADGLSVIKITNEFL